MNEEEAIEILKRIDIKFFLSGMNEQSNYIVDEADKVNKAIKTVLNLLEKKDKQIEQYQNMLATNDMLHVLECEKKDKIIDEMATYIATLDIEEDIKTILTKESYMANCYKVGGEDE